MSKHRKWVACWSMGCCGTDEEEEIDLIDDWGWSEEQVEKASDGDIESEVGEYAWEQATQQIGSFAKPYDEDDN